MPSLGERKLDALAAFLDASDGRAAMMSVVGEEAPEQ
jgi:hypothetical protein